MKQRVNFYSEEFQPKLALLTLNSVLVLWSMALLSLVLWWWQDQQQLQQAKAQFSQVSSELQVMKAALEKQNAQYGQGPDPLLHEQVLQLNQQLTQQHQVLDQLAAFHRQQGHGFGTLMDELAKRHHPELWLSHIQVTQHNVLLEGNSLSSTAIPSWLEGLQQTAYFRGMTFSVVDMQRDPQDRLRFRLSTALPVAPLLPGVPGS